MSTILIDDTHQRAEKQLAADLTRFTPAKACPVYVRDAAAAWLKTRTRTNGDRLATALTRFRTSSVCPAYLRSSANAWMTARAQET
jgi:hypothetical protein